MVYICAIILEVICILSIIAVSDENKCINLSMMEVFYQWNKKLIYTISFLFGLGAFLFLTLLYGIPYVEAMQWQVAITFVTVLADIDKRKGIIPNRIVLLLLIISSLLFAWLLYAYPVYYKIAITSSLSGGLLTFLFLLICNFISKGGFGAGDIKVMSVLGFLLGLRGIFNVFLFTMIASALTGIILLATKKKKAKDCLPLAPFLFVGVLIPILLGI